METESSAGSDNRGTIITRPVSRPPWPQGLPISSVMAVLFVTRGGGGPERACVLRSGRARIWTCFLSFQVQFSKTLRTEGRLPDGHSARAVCKRAGGLCGRAPLVGKHGVHPRSDAPHSPWMCSLLSPTLLRPIGEPGTLQPLLRLKFGDINPKDSCKYPVRKPGSCLRHPDTWQ